MAAISIFKWTSFYNDPWPSDYNEEEDTSISQLPPFISDYIISLYNIFLTISGCYNGSSF